MVIPPRELTRHAVCVGMTGSGKTGFCVGLLEDLAGAGVPLIVIDPKGDLANLALVFPELDPASIGPWLHGEDPREVAAAWRGGLEQAGIDPTTVRAWRDRVQVNVLTPGSESGVAVDVLASLTRAPTWLRDDPEGLREYVNGAVVALLGLIDLDANPLTDPPAILIARLLGDAWRTTTRIVGDDN